MAGHTDAECRFCATGRPHCHGTLIRHATAHWQCTEPGCGLPDALVHTLRIDCEAVGCDCGDAERGRRAVSL